MSKTVTFPTTGELEASVLLPSNGDKDVVQPYNTAIVKVGTNAAILGQSYQEQHDLATGNHNSITIDPNESWLLKDPEDVFFVGVNGNITTTGNIAVVPAESAGVARLFVDAEGTETPTARQVVVRGTLDEWDATEPVEVFYVTADGTIYVSEILCAGSKNESRYAPVSDFTIYRGWQITNTYDLQPSNAAGESLALLNINGMCREGDYITRVTVHLTKDSSGSDPLVAQWLSIKLSSKTLSNGYLSDPIDTFTLAHVSDDGVYHPTLYVNSFTTPGDCLLLELRSTKSDVTESCFKIMGAEIVIKRKSI